MSKYTVSSYNEFKEKEADLILRGDALDKLKELEDDSVDLLCTDPPYGYSFMGKDWDKALPNQEIWVECLRVLKPGAWAFIMAAPRQDVLSRMMIRLEDAGFDIDFTSMYWTYATGFPKANNIGKAIDKRGGKFGENLKEFVKYVKECRDLKGVSNKDIDTYLGLQSNGATASHYTCVDGQQPRFPRMSLYPKLKEFLELDDRFDAVVKENERLIVGKQHGAMSGWDVDGGTKFIDRDITEPLSDLGKKFEGSYGGFQPKPAVEVIIVAQKPPTEKTQVDQALNNGKGITWLDDCRIPYSDEQPWEAPQEGQPNRTSKVYDGGFKSVDRVGNNQGRFPANLLVSDDVLDDGKITKQSPRTYRAAKNGKTFGGSEMGIENDIPGIADSGGYSRFFSLDAWAEKNLPFLIVPKASKKEKNAGCEKLDEKEQPHSCNMKCAKCGLQILGTEPTCKCKVKKEVRNRAKNNHPTVKPIKLMSYLITMGSRPGDTILDPFAGSGTTGCAAEMLGREYILIEMTEDYIPIIEARIEYFIQIKKEEV